MPMPIRATFSRSGHQAGLRDRQRAVVLAAEEVEVGGVEGDADLLAAPERDLARELDRERLAVGEGAVDVGDGAELLVVADLHGEIARAVEIDADGFGADAEGDGPLMAAGAQRADEAAIEGQRAVREGTGEEVHLRRADEARDEAVGGGVVDVERAADLFDAAAAQDDDAVGHGHRLDLVMGDVDHRVAELGVEVGDLDAHLQPQFGVEVRERLVEEEDHRLAHDGPADGDALALAAGELAGAAVEQHADLEQVGGGVDAGGDVGAGHPHVLEAEGQVLAHGHVRVEGVGLEHHREAALGFRDVVDPAALDQDVAGGRVVEAGDQAQQGGLAAAGRADEDDEFTVGDFEVDAVDHRHFAEGFADAVELEGRCGHLSPVVAMPVVMKRWSQTKTSVTGRSETTVMARM